MTRRRDLVLTSAEAYPELDAGVAAANASAQRLHEARWNGLPLSQLRVEFRSAKRDLDEALALAEARPVGRRTLISALREHREELVLTAHGTVGLFVTEPVRPRSPVASTNPTPAVAYRGFRATRP